MPQRLAVRKDALLPTAGARMPQGKRLDVLLAVFRQSAPFFLDHIAVKASDAYEVEIYAAGCLPRGGILR
jgi:hypothetical protein